MQQYFSELVWQETDKGPGAPMSGFTTEIDLIERPKKRLPVWRCAVSLRDRLVFDSKWISLQLQSRQAAAWLAKIVTEAYRHGVYRPPPGHEAPALCQITQTVPWTGDLMDDCFAQIGRLYLHAEHMEGPAGKKGGIWYCTVDDPQLRLGDHLFHTADHRLQPRSGQAARWLCELVARAAESGELPVADET